MIRTKIERLLVYFYLKLKPVTAFSRTTETKNHTRKQKLVPSITYENEHSILQVQSVIARHTVKVYFVNETCESGDAFVLSANQIVFHHLNIGTL